MPRINRPIESIERLEPWQKISLFNLHIKSIYQKLRSEFGKVVTPLHFTKDYELCIAVILSAQCTDERVNQISPALFSAFPSLNSFVTATPQEIEPYIFSTGFYHNKAKSISGFAKMLSSKYGGILPQTLDEMIQLPGFGRKTANVVLSELYGIVEGIVVDTHVKRISYLLGLTKYKDPIRIEKELMEKIPHKYWKALPLYFVFHGRKTCIARKPKCLQCQLSKLCPSSSEKN